MKPASSRSEGSHQWIDIADCLAFENHSRVWVLGTGRAVPGMTSRMTPYFADMTDSEGTVL